MLKQLFIHNYILIESLEFDFSDGFMVVTGETGAGKSIFIGALSLLLGQRLNKEVVGPFDDQTRIEGVFEFKEGSNAKKQLIDAGFEDDEFIFSRVVDHSGRSVYRINRQMVTLGLVRDILEDEIDIHSQFSTQALLDEKTHLGLLDQFIDDNELLMSVKDAYQKYQHQIKEKAQFLKEQLDPFEIEYLTKEIDELESLNLTLDEEQDLSQQLAEMNQLQSQMSQSVEISEQLNDLNYESLYPLIERIDDASLKDLISGAYYQLDEAHQLVNRTIHQSDFDEQVFNQLNERAFEINHIKRRLKMEIPEILDYIESSKQKIEDSSDIDKAIARFDKLIEESYQDFVSLGTTLSKQRQLVANNIEKLIQKHAKDLNMSELTFKVNFIENESASGLETAQFLVSMNKNMEPNVLGQVASGGELSRLMLILKILFNANQPQKLIIFDEIDSGVSGKVAQLMGQKMHELSKSHRLLSVTHLPLIAAFADRHFKVLKTSESKVAFKDLNKKEQMDELAVMLASEVNQTSLEAAHDLIKQTEALKR